MNIDAEIRKYQEKIDKLEKKKKELSLLTDEQQLATVIHSKMCSWNHTDGCGWDYESWDNPGYARNEYLKIANNILEELSLNTALKVISYL